MQFFFSNYIELGYMQTNIVVIRFRIYTGFQF